MYLEATCPLMTPGAFALGELGPRGRERRTGDNDGGDGDAVCDFADGFGGGAEGGGGDAAAGVAVDL